MTKENTSGMYTVVAGDTLSQIVTDQCGKTSLWKSVAADNNLSAPYRIFANRTVLKISCARPTPVATTGAATHRTESPAVVSIAMAPQGLSKTPKENIATETLPVTVEFAEEAIVTEFPLTGMDFPTPETVASDVPPSPSLSPSVNAKPTKITGYKLVIPQSVVVAMGGIPLRCALKTEVLSYASDEAKIQNTPGGYLHLKDSWAQKEGDTIVLYVPKDLPKKPFNLFIAGIRDPIDGEMFMANAETFQGKFPGPNRTGRRIFSALMLGANGYMLASTLGPIAGPSVMGGMLITRAIMKHHAEALLKQAEDKFNASLAGGKKPSEKELGQ
jgi:hypothetical protein